MSQILEPLPMDRQTELMLKYGPKDTCWAATWGEHDEPLLKKYFEKAALLGHQDNTMTIEFFDYMEQCWNDHRRGKLQGLQVVDLAKTEDIPTIQGLQHFCRCVVIGATLFRYHGAGSSNIEARAYQQRLFAETEP